MKFRSYSLVSMPLSSHKMYVDISWKVCYNPYQFVPLTCVHGWVRKIQPAAAPGFSKINSTHLHTIMKTKLILNYLL